MVQAEILKEKLLQMLQHEHNWLINVRETGVFSLPKPVLRFLAARVFLHHQNEICPDCKITWHPSFSDDNTHEVFLHFDFENINGINSVFLDMQTAHAEDNLFGRLGAMLQLFQEGRKIIITLLSANGPEECNLWEQKWQAAFADHLRILSMPIPVNIEQNLWLVMWEMLPVDAEIAANANTSRAMAAAVQNMQYENMFQVIKKVIALRTNLDERLMAEEMELSMMFKMIFAREQGVGLDEVYDPEAFAGLTDSQIAAGNLVSDLQKTFNVFFAEHEMRSIITLKDLVGSIIAKKW